MELQFWGAAQVVTGSMHLLTVNNHKILLDAGLYQGRRKIAFERNRQIPFDPSEIDALVLSHAHIDHSGNIPSLVKNGFRGTIWCTHATKDLINYMLRDSAHIQEYDVMYVNKKRRRQGKKLFESLYTAADVDETLKLVNTNASLSAVMWDANTCPSCATRNLSAMPILSLWNQPMATASMPQLKAPLKSYATKW